MVDSICSRRKLIILIVIALCLIPTALASAQSESAAAVRSLAEFTPKDIIPYEYPLSFSFLSGNRLLIVYDRLIIVDLETMKAIAEAEVPDIISKDISNHFLTYRVQPLENGFAWIVMKNKREGGEHLPTYLYFQYDNDVKLIQEMNLSESLSANTNFAFHNGNIEPLPDGSMLFYMTLLPNNEGETLLLGKVPFDPDSDQLIYQTDMMSPEADINMMAELRLLNNGKRLFFIGNKLDFTGEVGGTLYFYGTMAPDGSDLKLLYPQDIQDTFEFYQVNHTIHQNMPQTSPIALLIPNDPKPELLEDPSQYVFTPPPVKSIFAWNVETGDITDIPLHVPLEDSHAVLSENGKYLATATIDDPLAEMSSFTVRLYDTSDGELVMGKNYPDLIPGGINEIGVSDSEKLIQVVYQDQSAYYYTEIPFKN